MSRRARFAAVVLGLWCAAAPAAAAGGTVTIDITASGPRPASATAAVGDTVVFRNADPTFVHEVASRSPNWGFNSGPLVPGQTYSPGRLTRPGEYDYQGANLDTFAGKIVLPAQTPLPPHPAPARSAAAAPSPNRSPAAGAAPPAVAGSPSGSSAGSSSGSSSGFNPAPGAAGPATPPLAGGFGAFPSGGLSSGQVPLGAPSPAGLPATAGSGPGGGAPPTAVAVGPGRLPEPSTGRRYGLPAVLALVGAAGVASLLMRLLLTPPRPRPTGSPAPRW